MSRVAWHILRNSHPPVHLMPGAMQPDQPVGDSDQMRAQTGLEHLVRKLKPTGKYATKIVGDVGSSEVHLAFEHERDARRFAAAVNAEATMGHTGWTTQQAFLLNDLTAAARSASFSLPMIRRPPQDKLKHEIYVFEHIIEANASTLTSKTMNDDDREALKRQITIRLGHQKLLQNRLKRLSK
jgi:hypothetical protein